MEDVTDNPLSLHLHILFKLMAAIVWAWDLAEPSAGASIVRDGNLGEMASDEVVSLGCHKEACQVP